MTESEKILALFTTRVRQMILRYKEIKTENEELYAMVDARDKEIEVLKTQLEQSQNDYKCLKTARMIEVSNEDVETSKKKIAAMIRDVNRCITMLSGK